MKSDHWVFDCPRYGDWVARHGDKGFIARAVGRRDEVGADAGSGGESGRCEGVVGAGAGAGGVGAGGEGMGPNA